MTGTELREIIESLGWTQDQAARELGVSSATRISEWCTDARPIPEYIAVSARTRHELEELTASGQWVKLNYVTPKKPRKRGT